MLRLFYSFLSLTKMKLYFSFLFCYPFLITKFQIKVVFKQNKFANDKFSHLTSQLSNDHLNGIDATNNNIEKNELCLFENKNGSDEKKSEETSNSVTHSRRPHTLYYKVHYYLNSTVGIVSLFKYTSNRNRGLLADSQLRIDLKNQNI